MAYDYVLVTVYNNFKGLPKKWGKVQISRPSRGREAMGETRRNRTFVRLPRSGVFRPKAAFPSATINLAKQQV